MNTKHRSKYTQTHTQHVIHSHLSWLAGAWEYRSNGKSSAFTGLKMCQHDLHEGFGRIINYYDAMMMMVMMMNSLHAHTVYLSTKVHGVNN